MGSKDQERVARIRSAAVLGAGVMGAAIAAHLANAGIPSILLDLKSSDDDLPAGKTGKKRPTGPSRLAMEGLQRALSSKPASFFTKDEAALVRTGNLDDDLDSLKEADWIIEAVVENLEIKKSLYRKIAPFVSETAILSTNTSGISVENLAEVLPESLRPRFLATHFFNPPRYLHLLELVAHRKTDPAIVANLAEMAENTLGKGIVYAKDTPNFIANRIGCYSLFSTMSAMKEHGLSIAQTDQLTGPLLGRPKSATYRTADVVGIDTLGHVASNIFNALDDDPQRDVFRLPTFVQTMVSRGLTGQKSGAGFYKKNRSADGTRSILMIDPETLEYIPQDRLDLSDLKTIRKIADDGERISRLTEMDNAAGRFIWDVVSKTICYSASLIPEISDDVVNIDRAMRWGFGWSLGPFEIWDAMGLSKVAERLEQDRLGIPECIANRESIGLKSFYGFENGRQTFFDLGSRSYVVESASPDHEEGREIRLAEIKQAGRVIASSADANLLDLGDGVVAVEFLTKMNTVGPGVIEMIHRGIDHAESKGIGLVLGNDSDNFCAGADLMLVLGAIQREDFQAIDAMVREFQAVNQRLRFSSCPVVVATRGLTLGGGCEMSLAADRICASAETYIGLVEFGAGLIPGGGGCKELARRIHHSAPADLDADPTPWLKRAFENVGMAKVSTSAADARKMGYLSKSDLIVMNPRHLIARAKQAVVEMNHHGYQPPLKETGIRVAGRESVAALQSVLYNMQCGGFISEHDRRIGNSIVEILCGGPVDPGTRVGEDYLLDLERLAFVDLCRHPLTAARIEHLLKTGKPLRN